MSFYAEFALLGAAVVAILLQRWGRRNVGPLAGYFARISSLPAICLALILSVLNDEWQWIRRSTLELQGVQSTINAREPDVSRYVIEPLLSRFSSHRVDIVEAGLLLVLAGFALGRVFPRTGQAEPALSQAAELGRIKAQPS